jgi:hypothetical protein
MKLKLFLAFILLFNVVAVQAQQKPQFDTSVLSEAGQKSYEKILNAGVFSIGGVGYGGNTSEEEFALQRLLKEKQAIEALKILVFQATPEGSLYALLGLRVKDAELFKSVIENYKTLPEPPERKSGYPFKGTKIEKGFIKTQGGCLIFRQERLKIVAEIEAGEYDKTFKLSESEVTDSK